MIEDINVKIGSKSGVLCILALSEQSDKTIKDVLLRNFPSINFLNFSNWNYFNTNQFPAFVIKIGGINSGIFVISEWNDPYIGFEKFFQQVCSKFPNNQEFNLVIPEKWICDDYSLISILRYLFFNKGSKKITFIVGNELQRRTIEYEVENFIEYRC